MKLSVIIPVYNVEQYIERCIRSVENQDFPPDDYEIIVINDGSPDNSKDIILRLMEEFSNIRYIEQPNKGLGGARNTGMREAIGEYILFIDSDDYIEPNCLNLLYHEAKNNNLDVLHADYSDDYNDIISETAIRKDTDASDILTGRELILKIEIQVSVWVYLYRRELLVDNKFFFEEKTYFEDIGYNLKVLSVAKRTRYIPLHFYYYFYQSTSISKTASEKHIIDRLKVTKMLYDYFYPLKKEDKPLSKIISHTMHKEIKHCIHGTYEFPCDFKKKIFSEIKKSGMIFHLIQDQNIKTKISFYLLFLSPVVYAYILHKTINFIK